MSKAIEEMTSCEAPLRTAQTQGPALPGLTGGTASQATDCTQGSHKHLIAKVQLHQNEGNQIVTFQIIKPGNTMVTLHHANKKTRFG